MSRSGRRSRRELMMPPERDNQGRPCTPLRVIAAPAPLGAVERLRIHGLFIGDGIPFVEAETMRRR